MPVFSFPGPHCRECGERLVFDQVFEDEFVGRPFAVCLHCGARNRHSSRTEWHLKNTKEKAWHIFRKAWLAMASGLLAAVSLILLLVNFGHVLPTVNLAWGCVAVGTVPAAVFILVTETRKISASNRRMKDPIYLQLLESAGIIRLKQKQGGPGPKSGN